MYSDWFSNDISVNSCWSSVFKAPHNLFEVFYVQRLDYCELLFQS